MPVGFSDGSTYADSNEWLADSFDKIEASNASTRPLGASQEPAGALKSSEGSQTPEKAGNDNFFSRLSITNPIKGMLNGPNFEDDKRVLKGIWDTLKIPGEAMAGKIPMWAMDPETGEFNTSHQAIEKTTELAALAIGGPAPVASKLADGTLGSFAGVTSKTLDKTKLYRAQDMELTAAHPDDIWKETGFFRGADQRWRYEIPDDTANILDKGTVRIPAGETGKGIEGWTRIEKPETLKVKENPIPADKIDDYLEGKFTPGNTYLEDVLHHPELFKAYPALKDIEVFPMPSHLPYNGMVRDGQIYMAELPPDQFQSTLLHEVQHVIQVGEGFARGGNPKMFTPPKLQEAAQRFSRVREATEKELIQDKGWTHFDISQRKNLIRHEETLSPEYKQSLEKFKKDNPEDYDRLRNIVKSEDLLNDQTAKQVEQYKRLMGEVESRNVQARMDMQEAERVLKSPRTTEDRPRFVQVNPNSAAPAAAASESSPIKSAAIKIGDRIFEGVNHFEAIQKAGKAGAKGGMSDGFITKEGKFVSRDEAAKLVNKEGPLISEDVPHLGYKDEAPGWWRNLRSDK